MLDASSSTTITRDIERIHDRMQLGSNSNKLDSVKRWLSSEKNAQWLVIFDNADDLRSLDITKYIPTIWGHVIITTRDNAAISSLGTDGCVVESLTMEEASNVVLDRAGLRRPSAEDVSNRILQ